MSNDPARTLAALAAASRAVARGGDLDVRLETIATAAGEVTGDSAPSWYLLGEETDTFVPAGLPGLTDEAAQEASVRVDSPDHALARAVRDRRPVVTDGPIAGIRSTEGARRALCLPLVTEDSAGTQEVEGVLVVGDADEAVTDALAPFADLAAAVVREVRLERAIAERADWYDRVAHTDPLTGLANRRTFDRVLELEIARAARQQSPVSLAIFDVRDFERINAQEGAEAGDDVLRQVASTLADCVRLVDTVARYGRDEFVVVAPGAAGRTVAQRVIEAVAAIERGSDGPIQLRVGLAQFPEQGGSGSELLTAAEEALRRAKQGEEPIVGDPA